MDLRRIEETEREVSNYTKTKTEQDGERQRKGKNKMTENTECRQGYIQNGTEKERKKESKGSRKGENCIIQ